MVTRSVTIALTTLACWAIVLSGRSAVAECGDYVMYGHDSDHDVAEHRSDLEGGSSDAGMLSAAVPTPRRTCNGPQCQGDTPFPPPGQAVNVEVTLPELLGVVVGAYDVDPSSDGRVQWTAAKPLSGVPQSLFRPPRS